MRCFLIWSFLALAVVLNHAAAESDVELTEEEYGFVLSHGPWPPEFTPDPSNRFSGDQAAIAFGKSLFSDRRLSGTNDLSCADCHHPGNFFADGLPRPVGREKLDRNTISIANLAGQRWYGWTGGADNLWAQSLRPILDPREMAATAAGVAARVRSDRDLRATYAAVFGEGAGKSSDETLLVNLAKALAAYQETLVTAPTPFDRFRRGLVEGDEAAIQAYPASAKRGLKLFTGRGRCSFCHFGPLFSNGEFHDIGRPFFVDGRKVDPGRYAGVTALKASPYTRAGSFSDEPASSARRSPANFLVLNHRNWGEWRVPSLRNVADTAPYMHDGSLATLRDVVRHYSEIDMNRLHTDGESLIRPLRLTEREIADLVSFLESLSGGPPR